MAEKYEAYARVSDDARSAAPDPFGHARDEAALLTAREFVIEISRAFPEIKLGHAQWGRLQAMAQKTIAEAICYSAYHQSDIDRARERRREAMWAAE